MHPPKEVIRWTRPGLPERPEFVRLVTTGNAWGVSHELVFRDQAEALAYAETITGGTWPSRGSAGPVS